MAKTSHDDNWDMVISYLTIRKAVGLLGMALPIMVYMGTRLFGNCDQLKPSISDYYYTVMGTAFTGTLCAVALFLFTYKGPEKIDGIISNIAAIFALCVAFFPCNVCQEAGCTYCNILLRPVNDVRNGVHYASAAIFLFHWPLCRSFFLQKATRMSRVFRKSGVTVCT